MRFRRISRCSLTVAFTLLASTVQVTPATASSGASAAEVEPNPPVAEGTLAVAKAAATGEPTIVGDLTTETTQVFANPDGTFTAEVAAGPVRVPDPSSKTGWTPIDTTLVATHDGITPAATVADVTFSDGSGARAVKLDLGAQRSFALDWSGDLPAPILAGDTATYPDVLPGVDLVLRARSGGFEQQFAVKEPPKEPPVFRLPLRLDGTTASVDQDGNLTISKADGTTLASADPALMWDSSLGEHTNEPERVSKVETRIVDGGSGPVLEIAPDASFFEDPTVVYPVVVDPSPDLDVNKDTYVESQYPNQSYGGDDELKVGTPNGGTQKARSFIKFNLGTITGTHVQSVQMKLWENWSYSCTASEVRTSDSPPRSPHRPGTTSPPGGPSSGRRRASPRATAGAVLPAGSRSTVATREAVGTRSSTSSRTGRTARTRTTAS
ncbi:MAG TPA: DNRLRE domain-containing protein [Actinomycetota bacterium]|nr:DNRLRE domain-containing protein [Actinomycetota bacterium]